MPEPIGDFGGDDAVSYQLKGVNLITPRMRRLALAVLAGVFLGLFGGAVAANADTPSVSQVDTTHTFHPADWW